MNKFLQNLYESTKSERYDLDTGMPLFDENKLRRNLKGSNIGARNKEVFRSKEKKFYTCPRYNPCPICDKCLNKASHLYVACQTCNIPICSHTYVDRAKMIRRKNFTTYVEPELMKKIKELGRVVLKDD